MGVAVASAGQGMQEEMGRVGRRCKKHMDWELSQHQRSGLKFKLSSSRAHGGLDRAADEFSCDDVRSSSNWFSIQSKRLEARPSACAWSGFESGLQESFGFPATASAMAWQHLDDCQVGASACYLGKTQVPR